MKSYKVELVQTEAFVVDVRAEDEQEASDKATKAFSDLVAGGMAHYNQTGQTETNISAVYDVTGTDDDAFIVTCPVCQCVIWDVAKGSKLNKCHSCGLAFD
jgi:hypothetical protein